MKKEGWVILVSALFLVTFSANGVVYARDRGGGNQGKTFSSGGTGKSFIPGGASKALSSGGAKGFTGKGSGGLSGKPIATKNLNPVLAKNGMQQKIGGKNLWRGKNPAGMNAKQLVKNGPAFGPKGGPWRRGYWGFSGGRWWPFWAFAGGSWWWWNNGGWFVVDSGPEEVYID